MQRAGIVAVMTLLLVSRPSLSQTIRGSVTDERTAPVTGVIVQLLDSGDNVVARALSNERGEYRLAASREGAYGIATLRIGFRPVSHGPFRLRVGEELTQHLTLSGLPVALSTVSVIGQNPCRSLGDSTSATFLVWEQARAALTAAQVTASGRAISSTTVTYERTVDPGTARILEQSASIHADYVKQPWRSLTTESLRRGGYVVTDRDGSITYHAPGLEVLLSDAFLEDHCFRIAPSSDADRVGIAFEPTPARRAVAEISGTLWLDRNSSELRSMEVRYTNISRERAEHSGSDMEFVRMSNGAWVISRWDIRMPVLEQRSIGGRIGRLSRAPVPEIHVAEIRVNGGALILARQGDDTLWSRPPLVLVGSVSDSASGKPVAGARVTLPGTSLASVTDAAGRFNIADVLPGAYTVEVGTASLDSIGAVHQSRLAFTDARAPFQIRVPAARQIAATICGRDGNAMRSPSGEVRGIVAGRVTTVGDSVPPRDVRVIAEWAEPTREVGLSAKSAKRIEWLEGRTDGRGLFRICGVPVNTALSVEAEAENGSSGMLSVRIPANRLFGHVSLTLESAAGRGAAFSGVVLDDSTRRPIANAEVALPGLSRSALTNDQGRFRLADIAPGDHQVVVRRIGYGALDTRIGFVASRTLERRVILSRFTTLESVIVTAERAGLPDFEDNRRMGLGHFMTRADLAQQKGRRLSDVIAQARGVRIVSGIGSRAWVTTSRGTSSLENMPIVDRADVLQGARQGTCYAQVYLDRALMYAGRDGEPLFDINTIAPEQIEAIEYYAGPSQTPLKYGALNSTCGVLVIHTRRSP